MKRSAQNNGGFTIMEMLLSIAIFILLITSAFAIVGGTTELMAEVSEAKNRSATRIRFIESCRAAFESGNHKSSIQFHFFNRGGQAADTYLSFVNNPGAFDFGFNESHEVERAVLAAEVQPGGFIRSRVYFLAREEYEAALRNNFTELTSPFVDLVPRLSQLSWLFYNERTQEWTDQIDTESDNSLVKLVFQTDGSSTPIETTFYHLGNSQ